MFVDPQIAYQIPATPWTTQILGYINGLTLPALLIGAFSAARWLTKKEEAMKSGANELKTQLETIRDNHLHHIQVLLDDLKNGQDKTTEAMVDTKEAIVSAQNSSKDAIVQAILTLKS